MAMPRRFHLLGRTGGRLVSKARYLPIHTLPTTTVLVVVLAVLVLVVLVVLLVVVLYLPLMTYHVPKLRYPSFRFHLPTVAALIRLRSRKHLAHNAGNPKVKPNQDATSRLNGHQSYLLNSITSTYNCDSVPRARPSGQWNYS